MRALGSWRAIGCALWVLASASCARSDATFGSRCGGDDECASGVCGDGLCTVVCDGDGDCATGWLCDTSAAESICACTPLDERCNGRDDDCDGAIDEEPATLCGTTGGSGPALTCSAGACVCASGGPPLHGRNTVDLLLVIDNSSTMAEEQATLAAELPRLIDILASGDANEDGAADFPSVDSLHVGVVTTDMGVGGHDVPTCDRGTYGADFGDDGVLVTRGRTAVPGCIATYPSIFEFERSRDDVGTFASDLACVATAGNAGCAFEQQLEATLKALSPSAPQGWTMHGYEPPVFFRSTSGHADRWNAGLVRGSSVLAIVVLTDEEDCSAEDPALFDPESATFGATELGLRCFTYPEATHPVERYVAGIGGNAGLLGLRHDPGRLVYGVIAGVPVGAIADPVAAADYDAVLAHPEMTEEIDPATMTRLRPSCDVPAVGVAFPPRRLVRVAQGLEQGGAETFVASICQSSYSTAIDALVDRVAVPLSRPECD
ncbi:MAG: hypothetical protein M3Y87_05960 [Myxococcota bacterium]|nr:hypothetical protein [Myxococcota bacterium]